MKLNPRKWNRMKISSRNDEGLRVRENMVEEVDSFIYLGTQVTKDGGATLDIKKNRDSTGVCKLQQAPIKIWRARNIGRKTKARLFKTLVLQCFSMEVERGR